MLKKQIGIKSQYIVEIVNDDMIKCQRYDNQTEYGLPQFMVVRWIN